MTGAFRPGAAIIVALSLGACSPPSDSAPENVATTSPAAGSLSAEAIVALQAQYAVLRAERAPEPRPSPDADPTTIPERLRGAANPTVLEAAAGGATFYADRFEGQRTASGIPFRQNQMVAAHRSFPFGTVLRVSNLSNDRSVTVRVVDRGPFGSPAHRERTIVDLSRRAAMALGFVNAGRAEVRVEVLEWGKGIPELS